MNDPAFLFYPGDYLRDTQNLSEKSQVAYDRIMCEHMRNISNDMNNITVSKQQVDFFTKRLNDDEKQGLFFVLTKKADNFQINWVADSIAKRKKYSESRSENRKEKICKDMKTYDKHMENENVNENIIKDIIEYLNEKSGKNFKSSSDKTKKIINARLKEKFTLDQFKTVIDIKCSKWLNDPKMVDYIRPETLFGTKFESYLNEVPEIKPIPKIPIFKGFEPNPDFHPEHHMR